MAVLFSIISIGLEALKLVGFYVLLTLMFTHAGESILYETQYQTAQSTITKHYLFHAKFASLLSFLPTDIDLVLLSSLLHQPLRTYVLQQMCKL